MLHWAELIQLSDAELAPLDIAAVNLACASGLPGAERIDAHRCLHTLDRWAAMVQRYSDLAYAQFYGRDPATYDYSESKFRVLCLTTALQRHCGVKYDPAKVGAKPDSPFELDDQFIHGAIDGAGGTCASLPVLYAAIGRRLGYPVRLARTKRHLFCRWDDPQTGERFNIEGSGRGVEFFSDHHYRKWPMEIAPEEEAAFAYLQSLTPKQELANFLGCRAFCQLSSHRYKESVETFITASELHLECAGFRTSVLGTLQLWRRHLQSQYPPLFPRRIAIDMHKDIRHWPSAPWEVEREIAALEITEYCLHHPDYIAWWWDPLRRGSPPLRTVPKQFTVDYEELLKLKQCEDAPCTTRRSDGSSNRTPLASLAAT